MPNGTGVRSRSPPFPYPCCRASTISCRFVPFVSARRTLLSASLRTAGVPPNVIVLPVRILSESRCIRINDGLGLIGCGADVNIQPPGQQLGEERRLLGDASVDVTIEVRAATEAIRKGRVRLERPTRVLAVLHEYERSIAHRADRAIRVPAQLGGGHIFEQVLWA